jgi:pimeloyl-ACP methyl ester carboxylesterase
MKHPNEAAASPLSGGHANQTKALPAKVAAPSPQPEPCPDARYHYCADPRFSPGVRRTRLLSAVLPCLLGVGGLYQALASLRDRRAFPAPGRLVEIDGCRMHLQISGAGQPTVVLESGLGGMSSAWGWIQPETAEFCSVVSYDRAGLGWSDPDQEPKSATLAARRLHALLERAGVRPPFLLVGHSMGGLLIRVYAGLFPAEVAGMVLLDAVHPDQHLRSADIDIHMRSGFRLLGALPLLARLGYVRLTGLFDAWGEGLPARQVAESGAFLSSYRHLCTIRDESLAWETICAEVRRSGGLGDLPLAVVTAGKDVLPGQPELQGELAALSSDSFHLVVPGADHVTLVTRREYALTVVDAIRQVVAKMRHRQSGSLQGTCTSS